MGFMQKTVFSLLGNAGLFWLLANPFDQYIPGTLDIGGGWAGLFLLSLIFGILEFFVKPILDIVTFPLRWLSLGLFRFVINGMMLWLLELVIRFLDFPMVTLFVDGWMMYLLGGMLLAMFHSFLHWFEEKKR